MSGKAKETNIERLTFYQYWVLFVICIRQYLATDTSAKAELANIGQSLIVPFIISFYIFKITSDLDYIIKYI